MYFSPYVASNCCSLSAVFMIGFLPHTEGPDSCVTLKRMSTAPRRLDCFRGLINYSKLYNNFPCFTFDLGSLCIIFPMGFLNVFLLLLRINICILYCHKKNFISYSFSHCLGPVFLDFVKTCTDSLLDLLHTRGSGPPSPWTHGSAPLFMVSLSLPSGL